MNVRFPLTLLLLFPVLLCAWTLAMAAVERTAVEVTYTEPESFTDVSPSELLAEFQDFLARDAAPHVGDGQMLEITVTDIDMAGGFDLTMGQQFAGVRQMRATFPPRIDFSFVLRDIDGRVLKEGERRLQDLTYLMRPRPKTEADQLFYEKLMISEWLMREF